MLSLPSSVRLFVARGVTDMRKSFDTLASLVIEVIEEDPQSGHLFLFVNRRRDRLKVLWWDRSGYCLLAKRLEHGRFRVFDRAGGNAGSFEMTASELTLILEGIHLRGAKRRLSHDEITRRGTPASRVCRSKARRRAPRLTPVPAMPQRPPCSPPGSPGAPRRLIESLDPGGIPRTC